MHLPAFPHLLTIFHLSSFIALFVTTSTTSADQVHMTFKRHGDTKAPDRDDKQKQIGTLQAELDEEKKKEEKSKRPSTDPVPGRHAKRARTDDSPVEQICKQTLDKLVKKGTLDIGKDVLMHADGSYTFIEAADGGLPLPEDYEKNVHDDAQNDIAALTTLFRTICKPLTHQVSEAIDDAHDVADAKDYHQYLSTLNENCVYLHGAVQAAVEELRDHLGRSLCLGISPPRLKYILPDTLSNEDDDAWYMDKILHGVLKGSVVQSPEDVHSWMWEEVTKAVLLLTPSDDKNLLAGVELLHSTIALFRDLCTTSHGIIDFSTAAHVNFTMAEDAIDTSCLKILTKATLDELKPDPDDEPGFLEGHVLDAKDDSWPAVVERQKKGPPSP
ncbi:hypothetical protein PG997_007495 [Apiospora hydei]|uniref:Uncharacterized protein n=1 Tax=Apiospora hydei TaxID=1337664 RepID=A0ABR1W8D4_9PEZI